MQCHVTEILNPFPFNSFNLQIGAFLKSCEFISQYFRLHTLGVISRLLTKGTGVQSQRKTYQVYDAQNSIQNLR